MNKRIQELAKQADNYAYKMNPEEDSYGRSANPRKFQQDRDAKFAELIVRECAKTAEQHIDERCDRDYGVGVRLKEHFGVEE